MYHIPMKKIAIVITVMCWVLIVLLNSIDSNGNIW